MHIAKMLFLPFYLLPFYLLGEGTDRKRETHTSVTAEREEHCTLQIA